METRSTVIYGFIGAFLPLATVAICARLYSRWHFNAIRIDDIFMAFAFVLYVGLVIATVFAVKYGLGRHIWDVPDSTAIQMQKCGFTSQVLYPPILGLIKVSILLFYLRTLPVVHQWRAPLKWLTGFIAVEEACFTVALFLQCRPIYYYWDKSTEGTCFNQTVFYYVDGSVNIATDLCILLLPWLIFRDLKFSKRKRYGVVALCSVGGFTLVASTLRLPYLLMLNKSTDPTWQVPDVVIWSLAEVGSAITLSSVPAIRPLIVYTVQRIGLLRAAKNNEASQSSGGSLAMQQTARSPISREQDDSGEKSSYIQLDDAKFLPVHSH